MTKNTNKFIKSASKFRLGIDFGYAYTGMALLDSANKVLDFKVLKHRTDVSKILEGRRSNRSKRRRTLSKIKRLRDFYALLKGMGIEPKNTEPGGHVTEREKASLGNRLYALAHYRGWDYASLLDQLIIYQEDEAPICPSIVKDIDKMLIQEFQADCIFNEKGRKKYKQESDKDYTKAQAEAKREFDKKNREKTIDGQKFSDKTIPFVQIKTTCLDELYEKANYFHQLRKKAAKDPSFEEQLAKAETDYEELRSKLENAKQEKIESWIKERLQKVYQGKVSKDQDKIILQIMTKLGLQIGEKLFEEGKIYRPHRNRHREKMLIDLENLMHIACGLKNKEIFDTELDNTFKRLEKSQFNRKKTILSTQDIKKDWEEQIALVHQRAMKIAKSAQTLSPKQIKEGWIKSAKKILNREYRKKRFENRNSMGKCPALTEKEIRCGKNVPKKQKEEIRRLQFEIELRQMNIQRENKEEEKLSPQEVEELISQLTFKNQLNREIKQKNRTAINNFFTDKKGNRYVPPAKNEARGKKDILKDIAFGEQAGRVGFCASHLKERLELIKKGETKSKAWSRLHEERVLNLKDDAPPSVRQKVQKTVNLIKKMLKDLGVDASQIEHIGIETARFDINSLAQAEGKKLKKKPKRYQESVGGDKASLKEDQEHLCIFCGEELYIDAHIDHLFPKAKGGGNIALNKVVGHAVCNINKGKSQVSLDLRVLDYIKNKNPKKYKFIQKRLGSKGRLPEDMLRAPQHTMFGSKLLKGALMESFSLPVDIANSLFPTIIGQDVNYLRRFYFPLMHKQKSSIRRNTTNKVKIGEQFNLELSKLKLEPDLFPSDEDKNLSLCRIDNKGENWLSLKESKIEGSPNTEDTGFNRFVLRNENSNSFILKAIKSNKDKKTKPIYKKLFKLNQEIKICLKDFLSSDKSLTKQLKDPNVNIELEFRRQDKERDWLKIKDEELVGLPEIDYRENNSSYIPWATLKIVNKKSNKTVEEIKIQTTISEKVIPITVEPEKDDPIRDFHHALDAVILAGKVDWDMIARLNKDIRERTYNERRKLCKQARSENAPKFDKLKNPALFIRKDNEGNQLAPKKSIAWYIKDKQNQRKTKFSKTDTEPLRIIQDKVMKKEPLEKITKENIKNIQSTKIRTALEKEWEKLSHLSQDEKKLYTGGSNKKQTILQSWFLRLPKDHILHPKNTRSVLCNKGGVGPKQMYIREDQKTGGKHYFKRVVSWDEVWIIEYNKNGKQKIEAFRVASKFYWKDKSSSHPSFDRNETDKSFPKKYKILYKIKSSDTVKIKNRPGEWKITKFGDRATLKHTKTEEQTSSTYLNLKVVSKL